VGSLFDGLSNILGRHFDERKIVLGVRSGPGLRLCWRVEGDHGKRGETDRLVALTGSVWAGIGGLAGSTWQGGGWGDRQRKWECVDWGGLEGEKKISSRRVIKGKCFEKKREKGRRKGSSFGGGEGEDHAEKATHQYLQRS